MVSAQVRASETKSERGREMAAGLSAFKEEVMATVFVQVISFLRFPPGLFQISLTTFFSSGWLACSAYKGVLSLAWLLLLQHQGPKSSQGAGWCFWQGHGPGTWQPAQSAGERVFPIFIPPRRDVSLSSSRRNE